MATIDRIRLSCPEDWENWNHLYGLYLKLYRLTGVETFQKTREFPDIRKKKYTKRAALVKADPDAIMLETEDDYDSLQTKINGKDWEESDLTEEGYATFRLDADYVMVYSKYVKTENENLMKMIEWMMGSVDTDYRTTCLTLDGSIQEWHDNLEKRCGRFYY